MWLQLRYAQQGVQLVRLLLVQVEITWGACGPLPPWLQLRHGDGITQKAAHCGQGLGLMGANSKQM